ncbi:PhaM family polyhydroxyalkanoate granule multifunctional regulatory protein [uncultured Massilia sp.]|uniref:PhaM family polyhydroxyalkanoate granule multifunctional regulatory protein n=1 Tax=uncultured Massilia sp. TaxID=169973 RepID=UPI0025F6B44E|nr:PhaM family polyhydroxyalkanoate granule multifunctional regulatory protein [uncultured Massilia sp.]
MLKPPASTIPGMTDTLDFVKNLWGSMHLPGASLPGMSGMAGPPLSIEDLDKRIADLKAVESWLNLNLGMLRGSIQALEVQRGTLATLKSMSASMAEAMRQSGVSAEKMAAMPFTSFFGAPAQSPSSSSPSSAPPAQGAAASRPAKPAEAAAAAPAPQPSAAGGGSAQPGTATPLPPAGGAPDNAAAAAAAAMGVPAAMAWWNMLQDQFTQAVSAAMTPADGAGIKKPEQEAGPQQDGPAADAPPAAGRAGGNGKVRAGRPKADKA